MEKAILGGSTVRDQKCITWIRNRIKVKDVMGGVAKKKWTWTHGENEREVLDKAGT